MIPSIFVPILLQAASPDMQPEPVVETVPSEVSGPTLTGPNTGDHSITLPKGLQILISVEQQIGSKISKRKDFFPIKLVQPVMVENNVILPVGIVGEGQVVHAKKGGFAGSAGELVLAARYLELDGKKIALRSFKFVTEDDEFPQLGKDNSGVAMAATIFAAPLGFLIGGGNTIIEPGTLATAKLREDVVVVSDTKNLSGNGLSHFETQNHENNSKGKNDE